MEKLDLNLKEFNTKLEQMKAKATEVRDDLKVDYHSQMKKLETQRDDFEIKYGQLKESSGQAWDDVKVGTEKTLSTLKSSFEKAVAHFK